MTDPAAFYRIFYQNETLFRVGEPTPAEQVEEPAVDEEPDEETETLPEEVAAEVPEPPRAVAEALSEVPAEPPVVETTPFPSLRHNVLVLVDEKKHQHLLPADAELLENILKATGHDPAQTDILNFSQLPKSDARRVLSEKSTHYFISFGVPLIKLQLDLLLPPYTPKQIEGIWFLLAEPLAVIGADKAHKKRLWRALKQMFGVS